VAFASLIRSRAAAVLGVLVAFATVALLIRAGRADAIEGHLYPVPEGEDRIEVEVLNGSGKQGLARVGTRALRRQGVDVVFFGNADTTSDTTQVILRRGSRDRAEEIQKLLGMGKIAVTPDSTRRVDVTVVLGMDWKGPEELHP
jgi:LytR cell envelope-related transcriptional attenuator